MATQKSETLAPPQDSTGSGPAGNSGTSGSNFNNPAQTDSLGATSRRKDKMPEAPVTEHTENIPSAAVSTNGERTTGSLTAETKLEYKISILHEPKQNVRYNTDVIIVYSYCGKSDSTDIDLQFFELPNPTKGVSASTKGKKVAQKKDVAQPTDSKAPPQKPKVPKSENFNWLNSEQVLPRALPGSRIIAVGIDIRSALDSPINVGKAAKLLSTKISAKMATSEPVPLLFIGHGFGGVVIQKLLVDGTRQDVPPLDGKPMDNYVSKALLDRTAGLVLFSCPVSDFDENRELFIKTSGAPKSTKAFSNMGATSGQLSTLCKEFNEKVLLADKWAQKENSAPSQPPTNAANPDNSKLAYTEMLIRYPTEPSSPPSAFPVLRFPPIPKEKQASKVDQNRDMALDHLLNPSDEESTTVPRSGTKSSRKAEKSIAKSVSIRRVRPLDDIECEIPTTSLHANLARFSNPADPDFGNLSDFLFWALQARLVFDATNNLDLMKSRLIKPGVARFLTNFTDGWGQSALHMAVLRQNNDVLEQLLHISPKLDPSAKNSWRDTPLHYAVETGNSKLVQPLLDADADISAENDNGETPASLSRTSSNIGSAIREHQTRFIFGKTFGIVRDDEKRIDRKDLNEEKLNPKVSWLVKNVCGKFKITVAEVHRNDSNEAGNGSPGKLDGSDETKRKDTRARWREPNHHWRSTRFVQDVIYEGSNIEAIFGIDQKTLQCRWLHVHRSNMVWITDLFKKLGYSGSLFPGQGDISERPRRRRTTPHVALLPKIDDEVGLLAVFVPYVSYDTNSNQRRMDERIRELQQRKRQYGGGLDSSPNFFKEHMIDDMEYSLLRAYLYDPPALHIRQTLDRYYYHMLPSTAYRDKNQVVSRWAERHYPDGNGRSFHNILMVDQLWLWKFKKGEIEYVVSCFPDRVGVDKTSDDNLRELVLNPREGIAPIQNCMDLVFRIVGACSNVFDRCQVIERLRFLQMFEDSIGRVSNEETKLFRKFQKRLKLLDRHKHSSADSKDKKQLIDELLDIREKTNLVAEVKDILDEVKIILTVVKIQEAMLKDIFSLKKHATEEHHEITQRIISTTKNSFERMESQATEIKKALDTLLGLKHNSVMVLETTAAREGAEATRRQGLTMLVFTGVTIIFLPLSFMASFFALDISSFPQDPQNNETSWPLSQVSGYIFGISAPIIILLFFIGFRTQWTVIMIKWFSILGRWMKVLPIILVQIAIVFVLLMLLVLYKPVLWLGFTDHSDVVKRPLRRFYRFFEKRRKKKMDTTSEDVYFYEVSHDEEDSTDDLTDDENFEEEDSDIEVVEPDSLV